ncbi:DNA-processing protein DprA [Salinarimonas ramus]|uniref:DNA processing protein DprA n=1 Tax=Salinarimonas ramus TaxID=690164 RepID=A0A917QF87_9HYPH|nr:DNA-processing protein DprA [Salinarimonas ramus]GGK47887.1 DNA processing protein DprA [Salinarimonas ramus]
MTTPFSDAQLFDWLRLIRSENVGPRTFRALVNQYGGAKAALEALPGLARKSGRAALRIASVAEVEREMETARAAGARFVASGEPAYPKALRAIDTAPPVLCLKGDAEALAAPCVAIVGSRNASAAGLTFAGRLARELADAGFGIVSGLARGVDTAAHRTAPASTVAVLAGGLGRVYPSENVPLLERIVDEGGAVLSEMPFSWEPKARDFPRRNRIVSGLSLGTVVVEAARRSGSLITARFANEQGRLVFGVPGSPLDPRAEGANGLIREGAILCASADHVISALMPLVDRNWIESLEAQEVTGDIVAEALWDELDWLDFGVPLPPPPSAPLVGVDLEEPLREGDGAAGAASSADPQALLLDLLGPAPVGIDDLARQAGLPAATVARLLTELELTGRLERHGGNAVSLAP